MKRLLNLEFPLLVVIGSKLTPLINSHDLNKFIKIKSGGTNALIKHADTPEIKLNLILDLNGNVYTFREVSRKRNWAKVPKVLDFSVAVCEVVHQKNVTVKDFSNMLDVIKSQNLSEYGSTFKVSKKISNHLALYKPTENVDKELLVAYFAKYYPNYLE